MRLSITKAARADIDEIWVYIATEVNMNAANRVRDSLTKGFILLRQNHFAGRSRELDLTAGLRSIPSGRYIIFYHVEDSAVRIVRVLHGSRDATAIFTDQ